MYKLPLLIHSWKCFCSLIMYCSQRKMTDNNVKIFIKFVVYTTQSHYPALILLALMKIRFATIQSRGVNYKLYKYYLHHAIIQRINVKIHKKLQSLLSNQGLCWKRLFFNVIWKATTRMFHSPIFDVTKRSLM